MNIDEQSLLLLFNWMSPTFPIGTFVFSHGMEQAIADGHLTSANDVEQWIADLLEAGSGWNDATLFALCWQSDIDDLNNHALALAGSAERYIETTQLGRSFNIAAAVWTGKEKRDDVMAYPVAAGAVCAGSGIPQGVALLAFLQGFAAALVSVAVRLVPLGQTRGLEVLRNLAPVISNFAHKACRANLDDLGGCCLAAEIAAMKHETLAHRIFRT